MTRFLNLTFTFLLATTTAVSAFSPSHHHRVATTRLSADVNDDFDAPFFANPQSGTAVLTSEPVVDDECYMGKDNSFDECVDFDPLPRKTRSMNSLDQPRATPKWTAPYDDDFDAPVLANPQTGTAELTSEPVVDDECYMGKDDSATECVDFDPPKRENLWTNYQDKPRGERVGLSKLL